MKVHACISIRGLIRRMSVSKREAMRACVGITDLETGKRITLDRLLDLLFDELSSGHEVLPIGEPCEGFSYKTGCPGHEE